MATQSRKIWTTDSVLSALDRLSIGEEINDSCFHRGDPELKAENILFQLTPKEEDEFILCSQDVTYFVEKYCKFLTDYGRQTVQLRDFQADILDTLGEEVWIENLEDFGPKVRNYILMASRQIGKTTTISAFFAWYLCFHADRNLLIIANKQQTTTEIVDKVVQVFRGLPFFLKPGIRTIAALGLSLDNGCKLHSQATTKTASIGFTIHVLYIDEFAHINQKTVRSFWRSVYPTLSSSLISQCIITSTPNGMDNLFYEIWDKSMKGINSFANKRVDYWEVPGHDDEWANNLKADFGDEEFAQEYELSFDSKSNRLLSGSQLKWIKRLEKEYVHRELVRTEMDDLIYRDKLYWHPKFDPNAYFNNREHRFIISNDLAEGKDEDELKDSDYNVSAIYQVSLKSFSKLKKLRKDERAIQNMFKIVQVGMYRDNVDDEEEMARVNQILVYDQLGDELCKLVTEMNFNGKSFMRAFSSHEGWYEGIMMHSYHTAPIPGEKPPRLKPGFKTRSDKDYFCRLGKKLIAKKTLVPTDKETVAEFASFGKVKTQWKGIGRHDDCAMACLNVARFYEEPEYADWLYDFLEDMEDSPIKRYVMTLLEEPYDDNETSDDMFAAMYLNDNNQKTEAERLQELFNAGSQYTPGTSTPWNR